MHAPNEDKGNDTKDSVHEVLDQVFNKFPRCFMKILFGDFNAKLGREGFLNQ
jgi:hypothetical protein